MSPSSLDQISVTEIGSFRECRRAWYLQSVKGFVRKTPDARLWFGDLLHAGLQGYGERDLDYGIELYNKRYEETAEMLAEEYGVLWDEASTVYEEMYELGVEMLTNYVQFDRSQGDGLKTVATEQRVWIPIKNATGRGTLKGTPRLTARMDRLVGLGDDIWIMDYKSGDAVWQGGRTLEIDDQVTGYCYVYWRLTGELPRGVIYETLLKRAPKEPRILKDGSLSTDKDQGTLYGLYLAKMQELGLMKSEKHIATAHALRVKGWEGFFNREKTSRNASQLLAYQEHLFYTYTEMREVVKDPRKAYPNPSPLVCMRCPFLSVCTAMEDGGDPEGILDANFAVNPEKRW